METGVEFDSQVMGKDFEHYNALAVIIHQRMPLLYMIEVGRGTDWRLLCLLKPFGELLFRWTAA